VERRKWPDAPHYGAEGVVLGEDDHGLWAGAGPGHPVHRGDETVFIGEHPVVWCIPRHDWFMAHFVAGHPRLDIYIDVVVWSGGGVELVDTDEFEQHRIELAYPEALVADARRAATDVLTRVQAGMGPFSLVAASPWLSALGDAVG